MGVFFIHRKVAPSMIITDYGVVSCWQERNLLAKIDREIKHKQQVTKRSQTDPLKKNKARCGDMR